MPQPLLQTSGPKPDLGNGGVVLCCRLLRPDRSLLQVIRHYHGHLSGVYALKLHPTLDILMTGGRDSVCRVWDMRSKVQVHCLTGHDDTVCSILSQGTDPQVTLHTIPQLENDHTTH